MSEWQPIETAPEWLMVLVYQSEAPKTKSCKTGVFSAVRSLDQWTLMPSSVGKRKVGEPCVLYPPPTHWMPLPEPPK